jgi:hypothetical protein
MEQEEMCAVIKRNINKNVAGKCNVRLVTTKSGNLYCICRRAKKYNIIWCHNNGQRIYIFLKKIKKIKRRQYQIQIVLIMRNNIVP